MEVNTLPFKEKGVTIKPYVTPANVPAPSSDGKAMDMSVGIPLKCFTNAGQIQFQNTISIKPNYIIKA